MVGRKNMRLSARSRGLFPVIATALAFAFARGAVIAAEPSSHTSPTSPGAIGAKIQLRSTAFDHNADIPRIYTGDSDDRSPPLSWEGAPNDAKEFALICDDPDAPSAGSWVHWVIYAIPADIRALPESLPKNAQLTAPVAAKQGKNSWPSGATIGYRGSHPPPGKSHHYHFKLYALDTKLDLGASVTKDELLKAIQGHILAEGELVGTYSR
jgi:Raf kinase inhibitor-like YbhB/YbcL family protein